MIGFLKRLWRDKRGNALVIAGAALPLVLGSAGLASDTIQWALWKRQLQRAADSAAIAGVYMIAEDEGSRTNVTAAVDRDLTHNSHIGYTTTRTVGQPSSGPFASDPYAVNVTLSVQKKLSFSGLFLTTTPTITANATATIVPAGKYCVVSLETTAATGISATGNASVNLGCGMITNSTSLTAAVATGSSNVTASPIAAVGGIDASNNWGSGTVLQPFTMAQEDPFKNVYPPTPTGCQKFSDWDTNNNNNPNGTVDLTAPGSPLTPGGTYCLKEPSGSLTIQGNVILPSGTYVLDATSLKMTNTGASLTCHQCTFVLTSSTAASNPQSIGTVSLQGGKLDLSASATGPFKGLIFYQDRRALNDTGANYENLVNGNSTSTLLGAIYFPNQKMTFTGTAGMTTECLQLVARNVYYSGNLNIVNTCPANSGASAFDGKKVRLVE